MNDEKYIHDISKGRDQDLCYVRMQTLINQNKLDKYVHKEPFEKFKMRGFWKRSHIIFAKFENEDGDATAHIQMFQSSDSE